MSQIITNVLTVANATTSGASAVVDTLADISGGQIGPNHPEIGDAYFFLDVTACTGTAPTMDVSIVGMFNGKEYVLQPAADFLQVTGTTHELLVVPQCPPEVKVKYTAGGTVTDFDATVDCVRVYAR